MPWCHPPFDFVPTSQADYDAQLSALATQIIEDLKAPDLILTQEGEDQDICSVVSGSMACGGASSGDGRPDTLQELALEIESLGGPVYQAANDRNGADDRGIVSGFLYRTDRVELLPVSAGRPGARCHDRCGLCAPVHAPRVQHGRPEPEGAQHHLAD